MQISVNSEAGFSIAVPAGWTQTKTEHGTVARHPGGLSTRIDVQRDRFQTGWSLGNYSDYHQKRILAEAPGWYHYEQTQYAGVAESWPSSERADLIEMSFTRRTSVGDCLENGTTHLYRSRDFPNKLAGYAVTVIICDQHRNEWEPHLSDLLRSFSEE